MKLLTENEPMTEPIPVDPERIRVGLFKRSRSPSSIYVGRRNHWMKVDASPLANPFKAVEGDPASDVPAVVAKYRVWLDDRVAQGDRAVIEELDRIAVASLEALVELLCFNHGGPCHAEVIRDKVLERGLSAHYVLEAGVLAAVVPTKGGPQQLELGL